MSSSLFVMCVLFRKGWHFNCWHLKNIRKVVKTEICVCVCVYLGPRVPLVGFLPCMAGFPTTEISQQLLDGLSQNFGADIDVPPRMNCNPSGEENILEIFSLLWLTPPLNGTKLKAVRKSLIRKAMHCSVSYHLD